MGKLIKGETNINGCYTLNPTIYTDSRGYFYEILGKIHLEDVQIPPQFMQQNISKSKKGVLRGLHFQTKNTSQAKYITVISGKIQDVVVDCRKSSSTYGNIYSVELSEAMQIFVPKGCAHGFLTLEEDTIFLYNCDYIYSKSGESGIRFNDPELNIKWILNEDEFIVSDKDKELPFWKDSYKFD